MTQDNIKDLLVACDNMDNKTPWSRHMNKDKIIEEVFCYAKEIDGFFECDALVDADETLDLDTFGSIQLQWGSSDGFCARVIVYYDEWKQYDIDLDKINMKQYGAYELPDFDGVVDEALNILNENYPFA